MPDRDVTHPRDLIVRTMDRIYRDRMTTTSGGNLSIREDDGGVWISPARVDKGRLTRRDVIHVSKDGTAEGPHPPSSEYPFHRAIYDARPDVRAVVHAHPVSLVAFSICRQTPETRLFHQAHSVCGRVGFAPYACPGSKKLGENIAAAFADGCDSVVLENHGVVVAAETLPSAFQRFEALEFAARTQLNANRLGEPRFLTDTELAEATGRSVDFESFDPPAASAIERELRLQLSEFVQRGCRQRLLISTEGSFSARLEGESFLITPTQADRGLLGPEDFVLVDGSRREAGKLASRAAKAHQAIYRKHPDVQSVVFAHPVHATAFSVTDRPLDVRTIPESYVFLRDVDRAPYGAQYGDGEAVAGHVSAARPAVLLQNDGVLVTGRSVLDAYDRLEVLDATAEALIETAALGPVSAMSADVIDELRREFDLP